MFLGKEFRIFVYLFSFCVTFLEKRIWWKRKTQNEIVYAELLIRLSKEFQLVPYKEVEEVFIDTPLQQVIVLSVSSCKYIKKLFKIMVHLTFYYLK